MQVSGPNPITLPVQPQEAKYTSGDISLTPQGETNIANAKDEAQVAKAEETQEQKDTQGDVAVDYLGAQSKKSQVEIYLSVATDSNVEIGNDTASIIETLRDVQRQNNAVEAFATYSENQKGGQASLFA